MYYLDAAKDFPFEDGTVDAILSEHLIEHLDFDKGQHMLKECYRILKDGGRIRVATPDMARIISLYGKEDGIEGEYVRWITNFVQGFREDGRITYQFAINNAFQNWSHRFLYDFLLLKKSMDEVGFGDIERFGYLQSNSDFFLGVEKHGDVVQNKKMVDFESLILEAKK